MQELRAEIRHPRRVVCHPIRQSLQATLPNPLQLFPLGPGRRLFVQKDRDLQFIPDTLADHASQLHTILHADATNRHKRHHIRRPDARMFAMMVSEIDQLGGHPRHLIGHLGHGIGPTGKGYDGPVMVRILRFIQQDNAGD